MKIAMLISGGVDSAVAVHRLLEQGHDLHLFYIRIGPVSYTHLTLPTIGG